ncbi:nucleotidyltransferase domain-containing protein [Streptomyces sp. NPDC088725]|uniref:nucleotidyltransferase domain-containing protein n=1 Tax=Streptomyces sp. NPDC088725 TaxID=3365873 RepID=UPI0037F239A0
MTADGALAVLTLLRGADVWIAGGWGIDALVGKQTRPHRDLDLAHRADHEPRVIEALAAAGFTETLDQRPVRFVMARPSGESVDLHPLVFAPDGSAVQSSHDPDEPFRYPADCFTAGTIGGERVPCLSAAQQVAFHQGYEPAGHDRHDMALLRETFGIATHF